MSFVLWWDADVSRVPPVLWVELLLLFDLCEGRGLLMPTAAQVFPLFLMEDFPFISGREGLLPNQYIVRNIIIPQCCVSICGGSRSITHGRGTLEGVPCTKANLLDLPGILTNILQSTKLREDILEHFTLTHGFHWTPQGLYVESL
jgi:hypothetical protein